MDMCHCFLSPEEKSRGSRTTYIAHLNIPSNCIRGNQHVELAYSTELCRMAVQQLMQLYMLDIV